MSISKKRKPTPFKPYWDRLDVNQQEALASKVGTKREYLYQIAEGFRPGGPKILKKLEKETNFAITKEKMRPEMYS